MQKNVQNKQNMKSQKATSGQAKGCLLPANQHPFITQEACF